MSGLVPNSGKSQKIITRPQSAPGLKIKHQQNCIKSEQKRDIVSFLSPIWIRSEFSTILFLLKSIINAQKKELQADKS